MISGHISGARPAGLARLSPCSVSGTRCVIARAMHAAGVRLCGVGSSVPTKELTNEELAQIVDTSDDWITKRTGIRSRRIVGDGERITQHSTEAAKKALEMAGVSPEDVDMVLLCTSTADDIFGSATSIQDGLGCSKAVGIDLTAACSGFVLGMVTGGAYLRSGMAKTVVVVGADCLSRFVDWNDRGTCILFGDGAGAVVMQATDAGDDGLLGHAMHSNGAGMASLNCPNNSAVNKPFETEDRRGQGSQYGNIAMNGKEVFKFAVRAVPQVIDEALEVAGLTKDNIDWMVLHQANQRILDAAAERYDFEKERVVSNLGRYGNTSAASIPLALDEAVRGGNIKAGETIAFAGFGAGLTWASAIAKWQH